MSSEENDPHLLPCNRTKRSLRIFGGVVAALTFAGGLSAYQINDAIEGGATVTKTAVRVGPPITFQGPPEVVMIGDSIGVMKFTYGDFAAKLAAKGIVLSVADNKGARPIIWFKCDRDPASLACEGPAWDAGRNMGAGDGIRSVDRAAEAVINARVVVLDLGQNTHMSGLGTDTTRMVQHAYDVSAQDGKPAIIAMSNMAHTNNSYVGPAWRRNQILNEVAANFVARGIDFRLIDVASIHYQLSDGIHPTVKGAGQLADYETQEIAIMATS